MKKWTMIVVSSNSRFMDKIKQVITLNMKVYFDLIYLIPSSEIGFPVVLFAFQPNLKISAVIYQHLYEELFWFSYFSYNCIPVNIMLTPCIVSRNGSFCSNIWKNENDFKYIFINRIFASFLLNLWLNIKARQIYPARKQIHFHHTKVGDSANFLCEASSSSVVPSPMRIHNHVWQKLVYPE